MLNPVGLTGHQLVGLITSLPDPGPGPSKIILIDSVTSTTGVTINLLSSNPMKLMTPGKSQSDVCHFTFWFRDITSLIVLFVDSV